MFAHGFRHFEVLLPWTFSRNRFLTDQSIELTSPFDGSPVSAGKYLWVRVNHFKQKGVFSLATIVPFHTNVKLVWSDCRWQQEKVTVRGNLSGPVAPRLADQPSGFHFSTSILSWIPAFWGGPMRTLHQPSSFLWTVSTDFTSTLFKKKSFNKTNWLPFNS